jgi:peroxiredoxin
VSLNITPTARQELRKGRLFRLRSWLGLGLFVSLCVVNLLLIKQNVSLRRKLAGRAATVDAVSDSLKGGESLEGFTGTDLSGQQYTLDYKKTGRQHLLLYFSPSCPYCLQQAPLWRDILNTVDSNRFNVLGVVANREDLHAVSTHVQELGYLKTSIHLTTVFLTDETLARYKFVATPTTLLISDAGVVEHVWVGKWDEAKANEVSAALK